MTTNFTGFWIFGSLFLLCIGIYFMGDATSFALMAADPDTGRIEGCYTVIDLWLGNLQPRDSIRIVELLVSVAAVIASVWFLSITIYRLAQSMHDGDTI